MELFSFSYTRTLIFKFIQRLHVSVYTNLNSECIMKTQMDSTNLALITLIYAQFYLMHYCIWLKLFYFSFKNIDKVKFTFLSWCSTWIFRVITLTEKFSFLLVYEIWKFLPSGIILTDTIELWDAIHQSCTMMRNKL